MSKLAKNRTMSQSVMAAMSLMLTFAVAAIAPVHVDAKTRLQAGVLVCAGEGGWGLIITSRKEFRCTFSATNGEVRGVYSAVIRKFGVDIGKTGKTALMWMVFGPAEKVGKNYVPGSLQGTYVGVGANAAVGAGLGVNALLGGGPDSFALQPISVQVQTGLSLAAGVQALALQYVGPMN